MLGILVHTLDPSTWKGGQMDLYEFISLVYIASSRPV